MPKCICKQCLKLSNGKERDLYRTTIARHMLVKENEQKLEDEYQRLHLEENLILRRHIRTKKTYVKETCMKKMNDHI